MRKQKQYLKIVKDAGCLMLVLVGIYFCLSEIILIDLHPVSLFFVIVGITLVVVLLEEKRSWKKYIIPVLIVMGFLEIAIGFREYWQGFLGCLNQVLVIVNEYYGIEIEQIPWNEYPKLKEEFFRGIFILAGSAEGMIWHCTKKNKSFRSRLLLPIVLIIGILLIGKKPPFAGVLLLLAGTAAGKLKIEHRGAYGALAGIGLIIGAASVFAHSHKAETILQNLHGPWQEKQWEIENTAWDYIQSILPKEKGIVRQEEIQLGNHRPDQRGDRIFEITVSQAPAESIYLRGFIGGSYENGNWQAIPEESFQSFAKTEGYEVPELALWLTMQPYRWASKYSDSPLQMNIKMIKETSEYLLVPYCSMPLEKPVFFDDGTVYSMEKKEYNWTSYLNQNNIRPNYFNESKSLSSRNIEDNGLSNLQYAYEEDTNSTWSAYTQYVKEHYCTIPSGLTQMWEFAYQLSEEENLAEKIPALLAQQAVYSLNLEPLPENSEFTEDFLFGQRKGYCVHFATAGTLLLRMNGIPARYVSGYCVKPEDFKKNQDGTYTAAVTDKQAHAWSEAFDIERGFYPVEMTPAAATEGEEVPEPKPEKENPEETRQQTEPKQAEEEKTNPEETMKKGKGPGQEQQKENQPGRAAVVVWNAVNVLMLAAFVIGVLHSWRKNTIKRRMLRFHQKNRSKAVLEIGKEVFRLLKISGYRREKNMTDQAYAKILQERIPIEGAQSWQYFIETLQKAAFSGQVLTEKEWEDTWSQYQMLQEQLELKLNKWQKIWWKYWKRCS